MTYSEPQQLPQPLQQFAHPPQQPAHSPQQTAVPTATPIIPATMAQTVNRQSATTNNTAQILKQVPVRSARFETLYLPRQKRQHFCFRVYRSLGCQVL